MSSETRGNRQTIRHIDGGRKRSALPGSLRVLLLLSGVVLMTGALLVLLGFDLRRIPDPAAGTVLLLVLLTVVFAARVFAHPRSVRLVTVGLAVVAAGGTVALFFAVRDLGVWLALLAFLLAIAGLIGVLGFSAWGLLAVLRRRGRGRASVALLVAFEVVALSAIALVFLAPPAPEVPPALAEPAELDSYLEDLVSSGGTPSVTALVSRGGETVYANAVGSAYGPDERPADLLAVGKWWSVTKIATAVAVLQLAEQGKLDLEQPVVELLPEFRPEPQDRAGEVTVADLLNHSAGLPNNVPAVVGWMRLQSDPAESQSQIFRERFGSYARLDREPGELGVYSNVDYLVLGAVVEKVSGLPYEEYVAEHILGPLGMTHTGFAYSEWMRTHESVGSHPAANLQTLFLPLVHAPWPADYIRAYDQGRVWFNHFLAENTPPTGLIGPAPEMMRLAQVILGEGALGGARILSPESVQTMLESHQVPAGDSSELKMLNKQDVRHGIAWFVVRNENRTFYEHAGGGPGWSALMRIYPDEDLAIVLMGNGTVLLAEDLADAIGGIAW